MRILFVCLLGLFCVPASARDRRPISPYITGDGFRAQCDFAFEKGRQDFDPTLVKEGNLIFVQSEYLERFFLKFHPKIKVRYALLTHNSDLAIPGKFVSYLLHPKIIAWFGQNVENYTHPKLHPIPIGLENRQYTGGDPRHITEARKKLQHTPKTMLLYNNFSLHTFPTERTLVNEIFKDKPFCITSSRKPYPDYLMDLAQAKFVLCPRGNGLDCHRTWEALYMGAIPVVKTSASDSLFEGLPVLIVNKWEEVTEELLHIKYEELTSKSYQLDRLTLDFWQRFIDSHL